MKITAMEEYGLRCMMQLAEAEPTDPMTVAYVAEREGLSTEYAGKLLNMLRQGGLLRSVRGRNGGFVLARTADEISLAEILQVFSNDLFDAEYCQRFTGVEDNCVHLSSCALRPIWWTLSRMINRTLEGVSLLHLLQSERQVRSDLKPHLDAIPAAPLGSPATEPCRDELHQVKIVNDTLTA